MFWKREKKKNKFKSIEIAVCSLLIHAAKSDANYEVHEKKMIKECLLNLGINDKNYIDELFSYSENIENDSIEILNMTKEIKKLDYIYRLEIIENLLKIIYSDQKLCQFEDRLLRKVAGLIYIKDQDLGSIRKKVKNDIHSK